MHVTFIAFLLVVLWRVFYHFTGFAATVGENAGAARASCDLACGVMIESDHMDTDGEPTAHSPLTARQLTHTDFP
jgi:hypothetical protein